MNTVKLDCGTFEVQQVLKQTKDKSVCLARNTETNENVILRVQEQDDQAYQFLALIHHAHLVQVFGVQQREGRTYIVEEYVQGRLLSDVIAEGPLARQDVIRIGLQMCNALEMLHQVGVVHRDIKPENVFLLEDGNIKLFDYDAARIYKVTANGDTTPLGTVGFAAPEQFGLMQSDSRSDIYSLGILLNVLLTGVHPTVRLCRGMLRRIVLRCTHVNPEKRYQTVECVRKRLKLVGNSKAMIGGAVVLLALISALLAWGFALSDTRTIEEMHLPETDLYIEEETSVTPAVTKLPAKKTLQIPMGYYERIESVQEYEFEDTLYHLILSVDGNEMEDPQLNANTRHEYLPEHEIMPVYLYVVPVDDDVQKIMAFKEQVDEVRYEILSENDEKNPFTLRNFSVFRYSDSNQLAFGELIAGSSEGSNEPQHRMVSCKIKMKNGDRFNLCHSMTQIPTDVVLSGEQYAMDDAAQLNRLLQDLELAYGWDPSTSVTLQLPETVYTEEIVIPGRAVILQGAQNGTVFENGLRMTSADDVQIILRNLSFKGDGTGSAIASARDTVVIDCAFEGYDTAWRALNEAQFSHYNCSFDVTMPPE